jgi:sulfate transport system ATP-binding protein
MTVRENVEFGLLAKGMGPQERRTVSGELISLIGLSAFESAYPKELSAGMSKMVEVARVLATDPAILLLDEPFGALDAQVRKELRAWLRRLHDEVHVTTVFVTHDQEEAMEIADEIVIINHGQVEQAGSPSELYDKPANDFVMSFLGPVTQLGGTLVRPHDLELFLSAGPDTIPVTVQRVVRLGFEVRVDLTSADGEAIWVQITRGEADKLAVEPGTTYYIRPIPGAVTRHAQTTDEEAAAGHSDPLACAGREPIE